ncbi:MAG: Wzz/FepE/Etk N-terminal domain-containing protein [Clostridia bacterium]|nr:Wzz/FepE/Etk N-terminal domain-containing protein [Clostridia bacterium]
MQQYEKNSSEDVIDFLKIFKVFKINIKAVIAIVIVSLIFGIAFSATQKKTYTSTSSMAAMCSGTANDNSPEKYSFSANIAGTFALFIKQDIVINQVSEKTGIPTDTIKESLSSSADKLIINLSYKSEDPKTAQEVLTEIMKVSIDVANSKAEDGLSQYPMFEESLSILSSPSEAKAPSEIKHNMLYALIVGCVLAVLFVGIKWINDDRYKDPAEIETDLNMPVISTVFKYDFEERK